LKLVEMATFIYLSNFFLPMAEDVDGRILEMRQKLQVMEWDVQRNQINPAKRVKYEALKKEIDELQQEMNKAQ
jgi:hypothetical protein